VRRSEAGFSLVAAFASIAIMTIMMGVAVPSWRYVMQNAREEELIFRGGQIADAIGRYQKKHGNAPPVSLEVLVKGKFLRKAYKDPMTEKGQWRFIRPGEVLVQPPGTPGVPPGMSGTPPGGTTPGIRRPPRDPQRGASTGDGSVSMGPFIGVATTSRDKSLRVFNGQTRYDRWHFVVGHPRVVGKPRTMLPRTRVPRDNPRPGR
jgi:type II secretory pathway pseudopilin PulG